MFKKWIYTLQASKHLKQSVKKLRKMEEDLPSSRSRFAIPFTFRGKGFFKSITCMQNAYEIEVLFEKVSAIKPKRLLEIGTARGGCLYLWLQAADEKATAVSVDLPGGAFGGGYHECRIPFYQAFAKPQQKLHLVRANSSHVETRDHVKKLYGGEPIDFIFIDGDHTYEGVKKDFILYAPLVKPGGLIVFHDIVPRDDGTNIQVDRFWKEIKGHYKTTEIVAPDHLGRKIGCGLLHVSEGGIRDTLL